MQVDVQLEGLRELDEQLRRLPDAAQQRVIAPAMRAAARTISRAVKAATPVRRVRHPKYGRGATKRSNAITRARGRGSPYGVLFRVGFRRGRGGGPDELVEGRGLGGRAAHLIDKGTGPRRTASGANRGAMPARNFFEPAVQSAAQTAAIVLRSTWAQKLAVEARRFAGGLLDSRGRLLRNRR